MHLVVKWLVSVTVLGNGVLFANDRAFDDKPSAQSFARTMTEGANEYHCEHLIYVLPQVEIEQ